MSTSYYVSRDLNTDFLNLFFNFFLNYKFDYQIKFRNYQISLAGSLVCIAFCSVILNIYVKYTNSGDSICS